MCFEVDATFFTLSVSMKEKIMSNVNLCIYSEIESQVEGRHDLIHVVVSFG